LLNPRIFFKGKKILIKVLIEAKILLN